MLVMQGALGEMCCSDIQAVTSTESHQPKNARLVVFFFFFFKSDHLKVKLAVVVFLTVGNHASVTALSTMTSPECVQAGLKTIVV